MDRHMADGTHTITTKLVDAEGTSASANGAGDLGDSPIGTLERGLLLLELFDADNPEMSLGHLREKSGLPKATIQRLMKTLEARKWVAYESSSRKYRLGASVLRISYLAASHSELVRVTHPILSKLAEETRETTSLCVWTDLGPLMLDTVLTPRHFKPATVYWPDSRASHSRRPGPRRLRTRGRVGLVAREPHRKAQRTDGHRSIGSP